MADMTATEMLAEALTEDRLNGGYFDLDGFEAHYADEDEYERSKAWNMYLDAISDEQEHARKNEARVRDAAEGFEEED
jgi:hypothetical protein